MVDVAGGLPRAMILGCCGPAPTAAERRLFQDADPLGFILFARNCVAPDQVRALVADLRDCVGRGDAPVLIDQEGGRVVRLKPPHWRAPPPPGLFSAIARRDAGRALEAARLNGRLIAAELMGLGITVNCAPVLDLPQPGSHAVIGDRAAGDTPERAATLGGAHCEGLMDGGVLPVIKHIPGHGRATVDSHDALPVVDAPLDALSAVDFAPFRALSAMPWAMTAHVVYRGLDGGAPATTSAKVIDGAIRGMIGFAGLLVTDDLSMGALEEGPGPAVRAALAAGCDLVLHCNGAIDEMEAVAEAAGPMDGAAWERFRRGEAMRRRPDGFDARTAAARLADLLEAS